ncbi:MAG: hypothetical protein JJ931_00955 [Henriciella sp.]|nr:hypothetical protein [Henriciella sp.]MBO6693967.1 hypothetical protein [Henriciella sp.]
MDPDKEAKRRKSIAYILRRRKRGRRIGANSGRVVKSWAEYSAVTLKPTGSYMSTWQRLLWFPIVPLAIALPFIVMAGAGDAQELVVAEIHPLAWVLIGLLALIILCISVLVVSYTLLCLWRAVGRLVGYKNE